LGGGTAQKRKLKSSLCQIKNRTGGKGQKGDACTKTIEDVIERERSRWIFIRTKKPYSLEKRKGGEGRREKWFEWRLCCPRERGVRKRILRKRCTNRMGSQELSQEEGTLQKTATQRLVGLENSQKKNKKKIPKGKRRNETK